MAQTNRLVQVGADQPVNLLTPEVSPPASPPAQSRDMQALTGMLMLALKALSQRFVVALAALADLALAASVFVLWLRVIAQPTTLQLVGLGMYGVFVLVAIYMHRRG